MKIYQRFHKDFVKAGAGAACEVSSKLHKAEIGRINGLQVPNSWKTEVMA